MLIFGSIFSDFKLPTAATWFYFSMLLAVALFFKFSRFLSVRNWDVVTIFLLVPGMLILEDARPDPPQQTLAAASLVGGLGGSVAGGPAVVASNVAPLVHAQQAVPKS